MQGRHAGRQIMLYISFNKCCCLASEGLVNLTGGIIRGATQVH